MKREVNSKQRILNPILTEYQSLTLDNYINYPNEVEAEFYTRIYAKLSNELENEEILNILNSIKEHSHKIELLPILEVKKYVSKLEPKIIGFLSTFFDECFAISDTISCDLDRRKPHSTEAKKIVQIIESIQTQNKPDTKKIPEKFYALYHCILIEMGKERCFERDRNGKLKKPDIVKFGKERYKFETDGQTFYTTYRDINLTNKKAIAEEYKKGYKNILKEIANNDAEFTSHLDKNYLN